MPVSQGVLCKPNKYPTKVATDNVFTSRTGPARLSQCTGTQQKPRLSRQASFARCRGRKLSVSCIGSETEYNQRQVETYDSPEMVAAQRAQLAQVTPAQLRQVVESAEMLEGSRVLYAGCGVGALVPHLQAEGVEDILAVDLCPSMTAAVQAEYGPADVAGNVAGVRTVEGDFTALPTYYGPFDAAVLDSVFGELESPRHALAQLTLRLKPGGKLLISDPLGSAHVQARHQEDPLVVPNTLPNELQLMDLISGLPLQLVEVSDGPQGYCAVLQVPEMYALPQRGVRYLRAPVVTGFGRGSKKMGVPTANMDPEALEQELKALPKGVYFGWAQVQGRAGPPGPMVMNVGDRPTFADGDGLSVEVHIMQHFQDDFYGETLRVVVLGFLRPELKFGSMGELVRRIQTDIGLAKSSLNYRMWQIYKDERFLSDGTAK